MSNYKQEGPGDWTANILDDATDPDDVISPAVGMRHIAAMRARDVDHAVGNVLALIEERPSSIARLRDGTLHPYSTLEAVLSRLAREKRITQRRGVWRVCN